MDNFAPLKYPCNKTTDPDPEFHPLRPYPGSPCDPLIPRKIPEAPLSTNPDKMYLTYFCGKSMNVAGTDQTIDVIRICGLDVIPSPIPTPYIDFPGIRSHEQESPRYRCDTTTTDICYLKKIDWDLEYDLSSAQLPFMGNTEIDYSDVVKVNGYLNWYLNGTIYQAEQLPLNGLDPNDSRRITTFSGPLNKLVPKLWSDELKNTLATGPVFTDYHNYLVACKKNIDYGYVRDALKQLFDSIFHNIFDEIRIIGIILSNGWQYIGEVGRALVDIYYAIVKGTIHLPPQSQDIAQAAQIFIGHGLTAIGNNLANVETILNLGRDIIYNIGAVLQAFSLDLIESCETSNDEWRLTRVASQNWPRIMPYVPFSTLEDTTGEVTVSVIPANQPTSPDIDGTILSISLHIDAPSDSRLYFPHLRAALALTNILEGTYRPIMTPTPPISNLSPTVVSQKITKHQGIDDTTVIQRAYEWPGILTRNTEVRENAPAPTPLYDADKLCDLVKSKTNQGDTLKPGPNPLPNGTKSINATLTYYQLMRYTPRLAIQCAGVPCPAVNPGGLCVNDPCLNMDAECNITDKICCTDEIAGGYDTVEGNCPFLSDCQHADANLYCLPPQQAYECRVDPINGVYLQQYPYSCATRGDPRNGWVCCGPEAQICRGNDAPDGPIDYFCRTVCNTQALCGQYPPAGCLTCHWETNYTLTPNPPYCPAWPTRELKSAARTNVFTKTPIIERLYDLLISEPQSLLRRWLPKLPLSATSSSTIKSGKDSTIPASTSVNYRGLTNYLQNTRVTAGNGGGGALYFPHLGSISDYLLGSPTGENLNLQRLLRPKGFIGSVGMGNFGTGINCNTNLPPQSISCVDKANYVHVAEIWTGMPEGTHAEMCFDDVVYRANAAGVNPGLSLLVWLNESDASNYDWRTPVEDFGIHTGQYNTPNDFSTQITGHLINIPLMASRCASELAACGGNDACRAHIFGALYLVGNTCIPNQAAIDYGDSLLNDVWSWIGGGCAFPFP
jgi:hypothetical protein